MQYISIVLEHIHFLNPRDTVNTKLLQGTLQFFIISGRLVYDLLLSTCRTLKSNVVHLPITGVPLPTAHDRSLVRKRPTYFTANSDLALFLL